VAAETDRRDDYMVRLTVRGGVPHRFLRYSE
jgi:hypothetical protein